MPELIARTATSDYQVLIQQGALGRLGEVTAANCRGRMAVVVTDDQVAPLYLKQTCAALRSSGFTCASLVLPAGEKIKTMEYLSQLFSFFHEQGLSRIDPVIALGGGVIGDLAGFAAATYLRGVPLIQVPTTLLAQVDSSIGGKTAVDLPQGKNLVGAFYQPRAVVMDPILLHTLPRRRMSDGLAEVIKYGLIADLELLQQVEQKTFDLEWVVTRCVNIKIHVVTQDEKDSGERMLLNFGHTIGHALEKVTGYTGYSHGEAVAVGMVTAAEMGERLGLTQSGTAKRVRSLLSQYQLPLKAEVAFADLASAVHSDKKRLGGLIHFIFLRQAGEAFIQPIEPEKLEQALREVWAHG